MSSSLGATFSPGKRPPAPSRLLSAGSRSQGCLPTQTPISARQVTALIIFLSADVQGHEPKFRLATARV